MTPVDSGLHPFRVFGVDIQLASADGVFMREHPAKPFVAENVDYYLRLASEGVIELFQDADGRWSSYGYMYELRLPSSGR